MNLAKVHFLGAAREVTGSKFLIQALGKNILIDCGVFQGLKELRLLNWKNLPIDVSAIDIVFLTHGHLDHVGYLPRLLKQGFNGVITGTAPTLAIAEIVLNDSAKIHMEAAEKANTDKFSKHDPALAFFTLEEAKQTINKFKIEPEDEWIPISNQIKFRFQRNGHIIGSTFIEIKINQKRFVFSGDIGRKNDLLLYDPKKPKWADYLFLEGTYGNKLHGTDNIEPYLSKLINETVRCKGNLIIPSFAIERLQSLMLILSILYKKRKITNIPIFIDSPMGNKVSDVFLRFKNWHKLSDQAYLSIVQHMNIIQSYKETWETIDTPGPKIIIAGSGMVTGGRVLTYLQQEIGKPTNTVLLVGYQAEGTRGRKLLKGAKEIKIYGKLYTVKARIKNIESLSAHADQLGIIDWLNEIENFPEKVFLLHGETTALHTLKDKLNHVYNWNALIPKLNNVVMVTI